jgi:uncharacterized membrane protein
MKLIKSISFIFEDFYAPVNYKLQRVFLIDFLRVLAIALMIIFHFAFDLTLHRIHILDFNQGFWFFLPRLIVFLFITSSGLSLGLKKSSGILADFQKLKKRIIKLGAFALIISMATLKVFPNNWVYFGTLHCLCALSILAPFFMGKVGVPLILGLFILFNFFFPIIPLQDPLAWVEMKSVDYIPLYPWAGVFLVSLACAKFLPPKGPNVSKTFLFISEKSLAIYLTHQVILYPLLGLFKKVFF